MADNSDGKNRDDLIAGALAQCAQTRKIIEARMPGRLDEVRHVLKSVSVEKNIRSRIEDARRVGDEKQKIIETIHKYLCMTDSNPVIKQSVRTLLDRYKH